MGIVKQHHIDQYNAEGCVRVENVFSQEWIDKLVTAIDRCKEQFSKPDFKPVWDSKTQNAPTVHIMHGGAQLRNFMYYAPEFKDWLINSPAAQVVGELMEAEFVKFWMDATFIKQGPSNEGTPWHNDVCTFPVVGEHLPSLWCALTDVTEEDGPMQTLAKSNKDPFRYHSPLSRQDIDILPDYRPWSELLERTESPDADIRIWPANAGDILLIHPKTIHSSKPRTRQGDGRRVAFTSRWVGSDVIWQPDAFSYEIEGLSDNPGIKIGSPLPDDLFPIRWQRSS